MPGPAKQNKYKQYANKQENNVLLLLLTKKYLLNFKMKILVIQYKLLNEN